MCYGMCGSVTGGGGQPGGGAQGAQGEGLRGGPGRGGTAPHPSLQATVQWLVWAARGPRPQPQPEPRPPLPLVVRLHKPTDQR